MSTTNTPPQPPPSSDSLTSVVDPSNPIGYCHTCDRQVEIDKNNFVCKRCDGGFIELFDMASNANEADDEDGSSMNNQHINIQLNEGVKGFYLNLCFKATSKFNLINSNLRTLPIWFPIFCRNC